MTRTIPGTITEHPAAAAASVEAGSTVFIHLRALGGVIHALGGLSDLGAIRVTIEDLFHTSAAASVLSVTPRGDAILVLTANYTVSEEQVHATLRNLREYYHLTDILWVAGPGHLVQEGDEGEC